jgi:hypothetical protein
MMPHGLAVWRTKGGIELVKGSKEMSDEVEMDRIHKTEPLI